MAEPYYAIITRMFLAQQALDRLRQASGLSYRELYRTTEEGRRYLALRQHFVDDYEWPLRRSFYSGQIPQVDDAIALLEVSIPARGLCYSRTWLLTRLKRAPLTPAQQQRLRELALRICASRATGYCRGAFIRLRRLMIRLADLDTVLRFHKLMEQPDRAVRASAQSMLGVILHTRPDLQSGELGHGQRAPTA